MRTYRLPVAALLFIAASTIAGAQSRDMLQLAEWLEGNYSNKAQAAAHAGHQDLRLHIKRIWKQRADGVWFYVEEAEAKTPGKPQRQFFFHLLERADGFVNEIYTVPAPARIAGAWKNPSLLRSITADSLQLRPGCALVMGFFRDTYSGATEGKSCTSDAQGAVYTTMSLEVMKSSLLLWDRGHDAEGKQAWGPAAAYDFRKE